MAEGDQSPKNTESPASGILRGSYRVSFPDVVRLGFTNADNIVLGDSDHDDFHKIWGALGKDEIMAAIAESGASHMFLELPYFRQSLVDEFQSRIASGENVNVGDFAQRFEYEKDIIHGKSRWRFSAQDETQTFLQHSVAPLLSNATRFDIDVRTLDYENGRDELEVRNEALRTVLARRDEIRRIQDNEDMSDPAVSGKVTQLRDKFQREKEVYNNSRLLYFNARHDDQNLAQTVNSIAMGQKTLTMLGFVHGSRLNDFEEYLQGSSLKIDIAVSRESYEQDYAQQMTTFGIVNSEFGRDPPELVYFVDEGVLATTANTPPELVRQIEALSSPVSDNTAEQEKGFGSEGFTPNTKWN